MIKNFKAFNEELSKSEVNDLLDKIGTSGMDSLTAREKWSLNNHSNGIADDEANAPKDSKQELISEINDILDTEHEGAISVGELMADSSPMYKEENQEVHLIEFFMEDIATVEVYGGYKYEIHLNSYDVRYEELDEDTLIEIRDLIKQ